MDRFWKTGNILCLILVCFFMGCGGSGGGETDPEGQGTDVIDPSGIEPSSIQTFESVDGDICRENGKPVVRLFSTTGCGHCQWISDTFDAVVEMYADEGRIVAYHWQLDTGDDTLTTQVEQGVPDTEYALYTAFSPENLVPTFVFGCKYFRVGTAYAQEDDLEAEAAEFMAVIEALIAE
jgi:thiol-disulfide isomerase/thioredoxin